MRRREILGAMAGAVIVFVGAPQATRADDPPPDASATDTSSSSAVVGPPAPPDAIVGPPIPTDPPAIVDTPAPAPVVAAPAVAAPVVAAPAAPAPAAPAPRAAASSKPDPNDPRYAANAFPPVKQTIDGVPAPGEFALITEDLNLRDTPDANGKVQVVMPAGSVVSIEHKLMSGYFQVNFQSALGWADAKFLKRLAPEMPSVIGVGTLTQSTAIYDKPDTAGAQVTTWKAGIPLSYYAEVDGGAYQGSKRWYKVMANPDRYISTWTVAGTPTNGLQDPAPLPKKGPLGWIGTMESDANVRSGPGASHNVLKTWPAGRRVLVYGQAMGEAYNGSNLWYQVAAPPEQSLFVHSSFVKKQADVMPVDKATYPGRWFDVNLTQQVIVAYQGQYAQFMAQTASGTAKNPTDVGNYPTFWRLVSQRMQGDNLFAADYYNLDAVPYIQYFHPSGEAIHGAYWHDNFGTPMSHGCVNTTIVSAQWMLQWAPLGTKVVVHQ